MALLAKQEKILLLKMAREAIRSRLAGEEFHFMETLLPGLSLKAGAFVTLHEGEALRGCIGRIRTPEPLYLTIPRMAESAAFEDPRFAPLGRGDLEKLSLEISVLSPPEEVSDLATIQIGEHGLIVTQGPYSGLLLPQVATEWGWDRDTFLSHTCMKAGLPEDHWKIAVPKIEKFSAEVFSEASEGLDKALDSEAAND